MTRLLLALLLASPPPDHLTVASPRGERRVQVVTERGFPAVATAQLSQVLSVESAANPGGMTLRVLGRQYDFLFDAAYVKIGGRVYPLAGAAYRARDSLFVPYQWAVELLPRFEPRFRFDPAQSRLEELSDAPVLVVRGGSEPPSRGVVLPPGSPPNAPAGPVIGGGRRRHVVAIDAGHGGIDVGMSGPIGGRAFLQEKSVTLGVARALSRELERRGIVTVMTRDADTLIALGDRGRIASQRGAQLFVSIHVNAAVPGTRNAARARGFETYFLAEARTEDARRVERMENASVRFETSADAARGDPLRYILRDLAQNEHLRESSRMASLVQGALGRVHPAASRGVKQAGFMVLATSYMPAVLIETGFGSNALDARWLVSDAGQRALAGAIADGIERYLTEYDRRVGANP